MYVFFSSDLKQSNTKKKKELTINPEPFYKSNFLFFLYVHVLKIYLTWKAPSSDRKKQNKTNFNYSLCKKDGRISLFDF